MIKIFCLLLLNFLVGTKVYGNFSFELGDRFRVLGQKGVKDSIKKTFSVNGNVVIINGPFTMYGGRAILNFEDKTMDVWDNIRLSSSEFTILAKKASVDLKKDTLISFNSRYQAENRTFFGEKIEKEPNNNVKIKKGRFTTCLTCQKDWVFYGEEIYITPNEYVRVKSGFFFLGGVPLFYFPYLIFPIKSERESGLLFPKFSYNSGDGFYFQVPFFLSFSKHTDMTFSPGLFGDFGFGSELELRSKYRDNDYISFNHFFLEKDRFDSSVDSPQVLFVDNINHINDNFTFHLHGKYLSSPELFRSFNRFLKDEILSENYGGSAWLGFQSRFYDFEVLTTDVRSMITNDKGDYQSSGLQLLPRFHLSSKPISLYNGSFFKNLLVDFSTVYHHFSSDDESEDEAKGYQRLLGNINLISDLNFVNGIKSRLGIQSNYGEYYSDKFNGDGKRLSINFSFESRLSLMKKFYFDTAEKEELSGGNSLYQLNIIGSLDNKNKEKKYYNQMKYFQHEADLSVSYYSSLYLKRSENLSDLISENFRPKNQGLNDLSDILPGFEYLYGNLVTNKLFPIQNTLFFNMNNIFTKNTEVNVEGEPLQTISENLGSMNVSQGVYFPGKYSGDETKLTRLGLDWTLNLFDRLKLIGSEYYYFDTKSHLSSLNLLTEIDIFSIQLGLVVDGRSSVPNKNGFLSLTSDLTSEIKIRYLTRRDFDSEIKTEELLKVRYHPKGKCWFFETTYQETLVEQRYFYNFALNYNDKLFQNLLRVF